MKKEKKVEMRVKEKCICIDGERIKMIIVEVRKVVNMKKDSN